MSNKRFMALLPPAEGVCQDCAVDHEPELPHDPQSFFYQTKFNMDYGRAPTWEDAMAHCPDPVREAWSEKLKNEYGYGCPECGGWKHAREDYLCDECRNALEAKNA